MRVEQRTITPTEADRMLEFNTMNRPVNSSHVSVLAREMSKGRWKLNGDTIVMGVDSVIDGQHRLMACVQAGVSFTTLVVYGASHDVFDTKDIGKKRSAGDTLATRGEKNTKSLAAALVFVDKYMTSMMTKHVVYSNMEIEELLHKYPGIRESVSFIIRHKTRGLIQQSVICGCHYLFSQKDEDLADMFCECVLRGVDLQEGEPVYMLRERLMSNGLSKAKLNKVEIAALVIKAWNATREGKSIGVLRWRTKGDAAESFPIVR